MSKVSYSETGTQKTFTLEGLDTVQRALGDLQKKSPAAAKVAINATAREARKVMIAAALARYAVNSKGKEKIRELVIRYGESEIQVTMTFGIAESEPAESYEKVVKRADEKLYIGKNGGRDQIVT